MKFDKKKLFFNLVYIFIILFLFVFIEIILRITKYGINTEILVEKKINNESYYLLNPFFINKYFPGSSLKRKVEAKVLFKKDKDIKTIRGFIIGESTSEGFPYQSNQSFGKMAEVALKESELLSGIELHNLSFAAMSSYYVYDVAKKILKYKPDFIVIYSGHNEYYGTLGCVSGKSHFLKRAYLVLKEIKIFQFLISIIENKKSQKINKIDTILMERMYDNNIVEPEDKINSIVVKNYIKNIEDVVRLYNSKGIPVILIEPVSNIFSMPPFKGYDDKVDPAFIKKYLSIVMKADNIEENFKFYTENSGKYNYDPVKRYLDGLSRYKIGDKDFLQDLIFAKDNDRIPFRAKEKLIDSLREFYINRNKKHYYSLFYIELGTMLKNRGENRLGNNFFCDHLHFNKAANKAVSFFLAQKIVDVFKAQFKGEREEIFNQIYNKDFLNNLVYLNPLSDFLAYKRLDSLFSSAPFTEMRISYFSTLKEEVEENEIYRDKELLSYLSETKPDDIYQIYEAVINYFLMKGEYEKANYLTNSMLILFPAFYGSYFFKSYMEFLMGNKENGIYFFKYATALGDKEFLLENIKALYVELYGEKDFNKFKTNFY